MRDDDETVTDYPTMVRKELELRGIRPTSAIITQLAAALEAEQVEFGPIGVAAAVIGFRIGARLP